MTALPTPCCGPCNRAHRDNPDHVPPVPGDPIWCPGCSAGIASRLADLDDLVALLEAEIDGHRGQAAATDVRVDGTKGRPSPSPAVDDVDEIIRTLEAWEAAYREHRRLPRTPTRAAEHRVMLCTAWLTRHLPGLLASDLARDFGLEVARLHRMARRRTSTDPSKTRKPIPCPRCDTKALWHHDGDRHVECENCGRLLTLDEYDDLTRDLTNDRRTA